MKIILISTFALIGLTGCLSIDKDRAAEDRKNELCREIETHNQPQCAGGHAPLPPSTVGQSGT